MFSFCNTLASSLWSIVCAFRLKFRIASSKRGVLYSLLMGLLGALGSLAFFAA